MENIHENQVGENKQYLNFGIGINIGPLHASWTFGLWFTYNDLFNGFLLLSTVY